MPDHVHLVLAPLYEADSAYCIAEIMQGIKSSSAHQINRLLTRVGQVWQRESSARGLGELSGGIQVDLGGLM